MKYQKKDNVIFHTKEKDIKGTVTDVNTRHDGTQYVCLALEDGSLRDWIASKQITLQDTEKRRRGRPKKVLA